MPEDSIEIVRKGYESLNEAGIEGALAFMDPAIEMELAPELTPEPQTLRGHAGVRRWFASASEALEEIRMKPEEFIDFGDRVVVPVRVIARGRGSRIEAVQRGTHVWTLRGGLAVRMDTYVDKESALRAVGPPE